MKRDGTWLTAGHAAPEGGVTAQALRAPDVADTMGPMGDLDHDFPGEVAALLLLIWGRLHGQVSLEVVGHHHLLWPDGCEALYRAEVARLQAELGAVGSSR